MLEYYDTNVSDCQIVYAKNPDFVLDVEKEVLSGYSIAPNPVSHSITINIDDKAMGECHIAIYNSSGVILQQSIADGSQPIIVDMFRFPQGMYLIQIKSKIKT